jgi:hypothetical protein
MQHGSSEEETSSEKARGAQERCGEEADRQEDRRGKAQTSCEEEEEVAGEGAGASPPRLPFSPAERRAQGAYPQAFRIFSALTAHSLSLACRLGGARPGFFLRSSFLLLIPACGTETLAGDQGPKRANGRGEQGLIYTP